MTATQAPQAAPALAQSQVIRWPAQDAWATAAMQNFWYIACPSSQLGDKPRHTCLFEQPLVVYRDHEGRAAALEDRCCHRGAALSQGRITAAGHLACGYHGWEYDCGGRCVHVPSLPVGNPVPAGFRVRSFPTCEQDHYVWVWMGTGPAQGRPTPVPGAHAFSWRQGTLQVKAGAGMFLENMLDGAHAVFTHRGAHPAYFFNLLNGFKEYAYEVRVTDDGFTLFYPPTQSADEPAPTGAMSVASLHLPDRAVIFQKGLRTDFHNVIHMVPVSPGECRVEWLIRQPGDACGVEWCPDEPKTLEQDRVLQESAQRNYQRHGPGFERHVPADYATLLVRRIVALAAAGRWPQGRDALVARKLVMVRQ